MPGNEKRRPAGRRLCGGFVLSYTRSADPRGVVMVMAVGESVLHVQGRSYRYYRDLASTQLWLARRTGYLVDLDDVPRADVLHV
jgi:hypothetical protein